jgi:hypothetical protein
LIEPEEYKLFESTNALIDYVNAKTKLDDKIVFIHSDDDFKRWATEVQRRYQGSYSDYGDSPEVADEILSDLHSHILYVAPESSAAPLMVENNVYSGVYLCGTKDTPTWIIIPFSAVVMKGEVKQFNEDIDQIRVLDWSRGTLETKAQYDRRIKKERRNKTLEDILDILFGG